MSFIADMAYGELGEELVLKRFKVLFPECDWQQTTGKFSGYDIYCEHCQQTVEVKSDRRAKETQNVCFEKGLFDKSTAEWVVYIIDGQGYQWDREDLLHKLKELSRQGKTRYLKLGDGWKNPAVLVRAEDILPHGELLTLEGEV
jgi:hypothetical protein